MANDDKVMTAVEAALKKNPDASVDELFEIAKGIDSGVGKLTKRQFHARYPLQVKRRAGRAAAPRPRKPGRKKAAARPRRPRTDRRESARDSVRGVFLKFASDLAAAESRQAIVKVVAGVDRYVDDAMQAAGKVS